MAEITLTNGMVAIVDDADYDLVARYSWSAAKGRNGVFYAVRMEVADGGKPRCRQMHRDILDPGGNVPGKVKCDHWNHDGLDNRRENLRWVDNRTNLLHRAGLNSNNSTGFRGVYFCESTGLFRAMLGSHGKRYTSRDFDTAEDAARDYNRLARLHHGAAATLNPVPGEPPPKRILYRNNTSGFRGVMFHRETGTYRAQVKVNGRMIRCSGFTTAPEAAAAYNRLARLHHGEHAQLNPIPGEQDDDA